MRWGVAWAVLFGLYLLLAGGAGREELVAAACCASIGAGAGVLANRAGSPVAFRFRTRWLRRAIIPAGALVADLARVGIVLARAVAGRQPTGAMLRQPFEIGPATPLDAARRALVVLGASFAPNGIAVGVAPDALLLHRLAPRAPSPDRAWPL